ncbi:uncharacterized protein VTP21DRAFT_10350 [Calcarisporiella thermophila]|uniref:uncharacterized protein n=1 Tax=Calcarisporiella thermophila TaxID=911321 RepID=UPI0037442213
MAGETDSKKALVILSFLLSPRSYESLSRILKRRLDPTPEQFKEYCDSSHDKRCENALCIHPRCLPADVRAGLWSFSRGYAIIAFVDTVLAIFRRQRGMKLLRNFFKNPSAFQFGLFLGTFSTLYRALLRALITLRSKNALLPPFIAGTLASSSILLDSSSKRRVNIALYTLTRGLEAVYKAARQRGALPEMPWWWGSWILFPLSSAFTLYAYLFENDTFPKSYSRFIMARSGTYVAKPSTEMLTLNGHPYPDSDTVRDGLEAICRNGHPVFVKSALPPPNLGLEKVNRILQTADSGHSRLWCALAHPNDPKCWRVYAKYWGKEGYNALKFMAVFRAIALLIRLSRKRSISKDDLVRAALDAFLGAGFIAGSIGTTWGLCCASEYIMPGNVLPKARYSLIAFTSSLFILLEPQGRRLDLGLYSTRFAIESVWKALVKHGYVRPIRGGEMLYFALVMGMVTAVIETQPEQEEDAKAQKSNIMLKIVSQLVK